MSAQSTFRTFSQRASDTLVIPPSVGEISIAMSVSVCLSVCPHTSNFAEIFGMIKRGSVVTRKVNETANSVTKGLKQRPGVCLCVRLFSNVLCLRLKITVPPEAQPAYVSGV